MPKLNENAIENAAKEAVAIVEESAPNYITFERYVNEIENYFSINHIEKPQEVSNIRKSKERLYGSACNLCYYLNFYYDQLYKDDKKPQTIEIFSKNNKVRTSEKDFAKQSDKQKKETIEENINALKECTEKCKEALTEVKSIINKYQVQKVKKGEHNINKFLELNGIKKALKFLN